jgi:hypothetical protein
VTLREAVRSRARRLVPGFVWHEAMSGTYWSLDAQADERAIAFRIKARASDIPSFLLHKTWRITGEVDIEGFADARPLEGTLVFKLLDERRLPYRFTFVANDGSTYELRGQKDWSPISPVESMTVLPASVYDEGGREIGRATLRFDLRNDLGKMLKSFRLRWAKEG